MIASCIASGRPGDEAVAEEEAGDLTEDAVGDDGG